MPTTTGLEKAVLREITWNRSGAPETVGGEDGAPRPVQFNPQTLRVNYANQKAGGTQPAGSPVQFVGKGTTKLTVELWFDVTVYEAGGAAGGGPTDVRDLTSRVAYFMQPRNRGTTRQPKFVPPGVRFQWGSFTFDGVMDSLDETLEFFSSDGIPLRASVSISISQQEIRIENRGTDAPARARGADTASTSPAGTAPFAPARSGESVQQMATRAGNPDWKSVALANGIENPRLLAPGTLLDLSADGSGGLAARLGVDLRAGASLTATAGVTGGLQAGVTGGVSGGLSASGSASAGLSASASATATGAASAGASASAEASASASIR